MPSSLHLRPRLSDLLKQRDIRLGVVGGHINAAVTEDEACLIQGHAIPQHLRSCCVAKQMRTFGGSINVGAFESVFHHGGDPISGGKGSVWGVASNEDMIGINVAGPAFQIASSCVILPVRVSGAGMAPKSLLPVFNFQVPLKLGLAFAWSSPNATAKSATKNRRMV